MGIKEIVICTGIDENREPVGVAPSFKAGLSPLFCYTIITGAKAPTEVVHEWYYNGEKKASVTLPVKGEEWRTWSSKEIPVDMTGEWR